MNYLLVHKRVMPPEDDNWPLDCLLNNIKLASLNYVL